MDKARRNIQETAESIRQEIVNNLIPLQIAQISDQHAIDKKVANLFEELSPEDERLVCDFLLGFGCISGVHATRNDVMHCLIMFEAAIQFSENAETVDNQRISKEMFYTRYLEGAIQCAWRYVRSIIAGREEKGIHIYIPAGMILMNMGTVDSRGRIRGNMSFPHHFQFSPNQDKERVTFKDLIEHLLQFGLSIKSKYQGRLCDFYLSATTTNALHYMQPKHPGIIMNNKRGWEEIDEPVSIPFPAKRQCLHADSWSAYVMNKVGKLGDYVLGKLFTAHEVTNTIIDGEREQASYERYGAGICNDMNNKDELGEDNNFDACSFDTSQSSLQEEAAWDKPVGCTPRARDVNYISMSETEVETELCRLMKSNSNVPAHELTFRELINTLNSASLGKEGKLDMKRKDWVVFRNSILFTSMFYRALMR